MAKKKGRKPDPRPFDPRALQGAFFAAPPNQKLVLGFSAVLVGLASIRYFPKTAGTLIPILASMFLPPQGAQPVLHPEAAEPVRTLVDERQLGRSEVIHAIAKPGTN